MPEKKPRKLKTIGDLRAILSESIELVMAGKMDPHTASAVVKLSNQINATLLAEIEVGRATLASKNALPALGSLSISNDAEPDNSPPIIEGSPEPTSTYIDPEEAPVAPPPREPPPAPSDAAIALASFARVTQAAKSARTGALAPRIIDNRPPDGVIADPSLPPPGRSALDQRGGSR